MTSRRDLPFGKQNLSYSLFWETFGMRTPSSAWLAPAADQDGPATFSYTGCFMRT